MDLTIPRTLVVTNDFPPRVGGVQQYVYNLVSRLPAEQVSVLAPRWEGWREHDARLPFEVTRFPAKAILPTPDAKGRVLSLARELEAEVALLASGFPASVFGPGLARAGVPYVVITHGVEYWVARTPILSRIMGRSMGRASRVTVISNYIEEKVRPVVPRAVPVSLSPPGVDIERFNPSVSGERVRERFGLGSRPLILCVSRLVPRKGQDVLIRSMEEIRRRVPEAVVLIVGDGSYRRKLEAMAGEAPTGAVIFAGEVPDEDLPAFHAAADVFAMPCRDRWGGLEVEGFGIVFMEAAASGRPCVAGDSGGSSEAVADGETGIVVDGRSSYTVAEAVSGLLSDRSRAAALGKAGRARAEAYSWTEIAGKVAGWLREAAS